MTFKRIISPTDFSETAASALSSAAALASKFDAELHIASVVDTTAWEYAGVTSASLARNLCEETTKRLEELELPEQASDLDVIHQVLMGDAGSAISEYAAKSEADLIVMASHARSSVSRFFLGSVADKLLNTTTCPVLLMRAPEGKVKSAQETGRGFSKIVVPTDFSKNSEFGIDRATALAEAYQAELHIIHTINTKPIDMLDKSTKKLAMDGAKEATDEKLDKLASSRNENLKVKTAILEGEPAESISNYASSESCDLIVIGSRGLGEISRLLLGSVADKVLRLAECPIFVEHGKS